MKKKTVSTAQPVKKTQKSDAVSLLKEDHRKVEQLFAKFEESEDQDEKRELVRQICLELIIHTRLEEEIFYPACRHKDVEPDLMDEAQVEHDGAKVLIGNLLRVQPDSEFYDAKVKTLSEYIKHHVAEEEKPRSGIFARAQKAGVEMEELGAGIQTRKKELMGQSETMTSQPPQPRSFQLQSGKEDKMARNSNDRDERGRFTDDNDNRGGYRGGGQNRERDDQGRFASDDDNGRGYRSQGPGERGRYGDDDNRSRGGGRGQGGQGGQGQGGWFGDSEGHSRAAREGWDDRGSSRSRGYDDDRGRSQGSQGGGGQQGRGQGGWFGDSEGHSQASREGWRNSSHEGSGWYGDSRGHSQAAREGWEDRSRQSRGRDDDSDYRGRQSGRNDDDDDRGRQGGGGRGHGGWFGDSEGHSQAAREGWRNR